MSEVRLVGDSGRQHEPLTTRLRNLIGDYPRGIGILKEFIQNADDAGATVIKFIADWRTYPSELLPADSMRILMGPALLIYNNGEFSAEDFKAIQDIGRGSKSLKAAKTGRFGLGFNVAYNVTDYPSFISGALRRIQFFDPHERTIPADKDGARGGCNYTLDDLWKLCPDTLKPFELFGFSADRPCKGTIFRLPFRTLEQGPSSEICQVPFTKNDFDQTIRPLYNAGGELLLFLKNVLEIQIFEIHPGEETPSPLILIKTLNASDVSVARDKINQFTLDEMQTMVAQIATSASLPAVTYRHKIQVTNHGEKHIENWLVVNGLFKDSAHEIVNIMSRMLKHQELSLPWAGKALPWGGVACRLDRRSIKDVEGKVYCFLPLPEKSGLPFHVNGYFDLNSTRQGITSDETLTGPEADRYLWNKLLIRHVIAQAYAQLIKVLAQEIGTAHTQIYYGLWPDVDRPLPGIWNDLATWVYHYLENAPAILTGLETRWQSIKQVRLIPAKWDAIRQPLVADGVSVPEPALPERIQSGFSRAGISLTEITPQFVRDRLRVSDDVNCSLEDAPRKCLKKRQWVAALLKFCAQPPHDDGEKLRGLPLLLLYDGKLHTVGNYKGCNYVMVDSSKEEREIFKQYPQWFVDPEFAQQTQISALPKVNIKCMNASLVAVNLSVILQKLDTGQSCTWNPDSAEIPNAKWLAKALRYLAKNKSGLTANLDELKKLALIPDQYGRLWRLGDDYTPLIPHPDEKQELLDALQKLIPIISGPMDLVKAVREFAASFSDLIWFVTPRDLVDTLNAFKQTWEAQNTIYNPRTHGFVLDYLATDNATEMLRKEDRLGKLRGLAIFPLQNGAIVSGNEPDVFIPSVKPPEIAGEVRLLETGPSGRWRELLRYLNFKELDLPNLIYKVIEGYQALQPKKQVDALRWIRSNLDTAEDYLDQHVGATASANLRRAVADAELIICIDHNRHSARRVYDPDNPIIRKVLGQRALIPDMKVYKGNKGHWLEFFKKLGMEETPRAQDLLDYIDTLIADARAEDLQPTAKLISNVFSHMREHWETLSKALVQSTPGTAIPLADALKKRAWLPARYTQAELKYYPGALLPDARLYRASELALPQNAHRVASQQPIAAIFGESQFSEMFTALGFVLYPELDVVLRHFSKLLELWKAKTSGVGIQEFEASLRSIYQFLGSQYIQRDAQFTSSLKDEWREIPCIWDFREEDQGGKQFWKPKHVFKEQSSRLYPYRIQFSQVPDAIDRGFDTLGRLKNPQFADYVELLQELSQKTLICPLEDNDCVLVRYVLRQIAFDPTLALHDISRLPLLTTTNQLVTADQIFVNDAPWFAERIQPGEVFLLNPATPQELISAAKLMYLSESLEEILLNVIPVEDDTPGIRICKAWESNIHSAEFLRGLVRLIKHYDAGIIRPNAFGWLSCLAIEASAQVQVGLVVKSNQKRLENSGEAGIYFDEKEYTIYLKAQQERLMENNLAKIINHHLDENRLPEHVELAILLSTQPDHIARTLSEMRIRQLPDDITRDDISDEQSEVVFPPALADGQGLENEGNAIDGTTESPSEGGLQDAADQVEQDRKHAETNKPEGQTTSAKIQLQPDSVKQAPGQSQESQENGSQNIKDEQEGHQNVTQGKRINGHKESGGSGFGQGESGGDNGPRAPTGEDVPPPTQPGAGKSPAGEHSGDGGSGIDNPPREPWAGKQPGKRPGGHSRNDRIFTSGVYSHQGQQSESGETDSQNDEIGNLAVDRVVADEIGQGYKPKRMPHNNPGYDLEIYAADGQTLLKYIEVKGINGPWGVGGVSISATQYNFGELHPDKFWLYVVEYALDDNAFRIYPIQNPTRQITHYRFDHGWKELAEVESKFEAEPAIGLYVRNKLDQSVGIIVKIKGMGLLKQITVRFENGREERMTFKPNLMELIDASGE